MGVSGARADAKQVTLTPKAESSSTYLRDMVAAERQERLLDRFVCKLDYRAVHLRFIRSLVCLVPQTYSELLYIYVTYLYQFCIILTYIHNINAPYKSSGRLSALHFHRLPVPVNLNEVNFKN